MPALIAVAVAALMGALAMYSAWAVAAIEKAHPPVGRFVDVEGGRLHVVEMGPPDAPPVVLLHGASGNLRDMRLALGEGLARQYRVIMVDRPGHGWSARHGGPADASPARQAALIHQALETIGVRRAILVGHSWSGALATAYALDHPQSVAGLLLLAPVTHPWETGVAWYHHVLTTPLAGPVFARTLAFPIGKLLLGPGIQNVFAPQQAPPDYAQRAGAELLLRPAELIANAQDMIGLKAFVTAQAPRYGGIEAPTVIIHGDADDTVSLDIHARAIAPMLPRGRLIVLPGVGHMVHHVAREQVLQALAELPALKINPRQ
jgi:pimeloyl-ACP methyl ester carboxylesterase